MSLKKEIAKLCKTWCENPIDCEIEPPLDQFNETSSLLFRFTDFEDTKDDWHVIELSFFEKMVSIEEIKLFLEKIPNNKKIKTKVIVSKLGFSIDASILANQNRIWLCHFGELEKETNSFGYFHNYISKQHMHASVELNNQQWQNINNQIEQSGFHFMRGNPKIKAEILDEHFQKKCDFKNLEFALPKSTDISNRDYKFELPNCYLKITDVDAIPINGISFNYYTEFRKIEADNLIEALGEALSTYIFE